ncbi:MAG: fatty acid--CoA ligase [Gammaproteobacteria bacterium]
MSPIEPESATEAYDFPLLVKQLLLSPLLNTPGQEIVYADGQRYDYRGLGERIHRLANVLDALGVREGSTVAVMDWDSHRYLECFFAVPMMGAVLHTINVRLSPEQILYTINHAEDDVLLVHTDFLALVEGIRERIEQPLTIVPMTDAGVEAGDTAGEYERLLAQAASEFDFPDFDERIRATTFYTTGTTGNPKGVYYSQRQLVLHTLGILAMVGSNGEHARFHKDDVYMPITPMFHVHAWGMPFIATTMGVKQVYPGRYEPEKLLRLIESEKVTFSHCVPTILHMLLSSPVADSVDLSGWKVVIGGSAMPGALAKAALDRGIDVFSGYGMSETGPVLTIAQLERSMLSGDQAELDLRCRAGRAGPLVDLRVVDEQMRDQARGDEGEVVVRAPWLTPGYLKNPQGSRSLWQGGYLHTGDLGYLDEQGYLKITDRLKDVIKTGGEWISSLTLEDIVTGHPGVAEAAAIGVPDEKWGERPVVLVVPRADLDEPLTPEDVRDRIEHAASAGEVSKWAVPERVEIIDSLAKTSVGKLDKKKLREQWS